MLSLGRWQEGNYYWNGYINCLGHCHLQPQVREEAGELCQTLEADEGRERAASEAADLLYHAMVLLNVQVRGDITDWLIRCVCCVPGWVCVDAASEAADLL